MTARGAFSLIELLVVMAIFMVLAALLFPVFSGVRERSKIDSCVSQLHQVGFAIQMYRSDNDDQAWLTYSVLSSERGGLYTTAGKYRTPWNEWQPAEPYLKDSRLVGCPLPNRDPLEGQTTVEDGHGVYHDSYTSYIYRQIAPPGLAHEDSITTWYPLDPASGSVVAFCRNHTTDERAKRGGFATGSLDLYEGGYPVVREDGSAAIVQSAQIKPWYLWQDDSWHEEESPTLGGSSEVWRFPKESWPPVLPWK